MTEVLKKVEEGIARQYEELAGYFGMDPTITRIYMAVFFAEQPIGLEELSERTGYSMSTICTKMPNIEKTFDIVRFKKPGSKKNYNRWENDCRSIIEKRSVILRKFVENMKRTLDEAEELLSSSKDKKARSHLEKIRILKDSYLKMDQIIEKHKGFFGGTI